MFNSIYLDVAIGMVFLFLLYSLLTTAIQELMATWLSLRGKYLFKSIGVMLGDRKTGSSLVEDFYNHPLIRKSSLKKVDKLPSYIAPEVFTKVLKDILPTLYLGKGVELTTDQQIKLLPDGDLKTSLLSYTEKGTRDFETKVQDWFNDTMDRLSGSYKRSTQNRVLIIGVIVAIVFNVDSLSVFRRLATDKKARLQAVALAERFMEKNTEYERLEAKFAGKVDSSAARSAVDTAGEIQTDTTATDTSGRNNTTPAQVDTTNSTVDTAAVARIQRIREQQTADSALFEQFKRQRAQLAKLLDSDIKDLNNALGIGWDAFDFETAKKQWGGGLFAVLLLGLGWFITALAISVGAPFWFDLLQKIIRLRGAGAKPLTESQKAAGVK